MRRIAESQNVSLDIHSASARAAERYQLQGIEADTLSGEQLGLGNLGAGLRIESIRRVEWFLDAEADFSLMSAKLADVPRLGWEIWTVVPQQCLGEAHRVFRDVADRIQGAWAREDGTVVFSVPEIP